MADITIMLIIAIGGLVIAGVFISLVLMKLGRGFGGLHNFFSSALEQTFQGLGTEIREESRWGREELRDALGSHQQALEVRLTNFGRLQVDQLGALRKEATDGRTALEGALKRDADAFSETQAKRLAETNAAMRDLADRLVTQIKSLTDSNEKRQEAIRETLNSNLEQLRKDNDAKLEQMRQTVDERLQGTLEARLGESFKQVSEQLTKVHQGLGEMQNLASDVGGLQRALSNVKVRGSWGEAQLGALLEDFLTADQYAKNVQITGTMEAVEFAIKMPGQEENGEPVWLPIDSKYPQEDYERLLNGQEEGDPDKVKQYSAALERVIRQQAKTIKEKYVHPPHSVDFAIMFLPTEGLFAEAARRPGLCTDIFLRRKVASPTTLPALLTSLRMGFRTVAISKRVSEVWNVLGAAKAEFNNYADAWKRLERHLNTAQNTVQELGRRTRAVERKLHNVEAMERPNGHTDSPALQSAFEDGEEAEQYEMGSTMAAGVAPQPAPRG